MQNSTDFIQRIITAASESPEVKKQLMENPKGVIESILKFQLPDDFEINIFEDTPNRIHIVLPDNTEELSEVELSAVSGGIMGAVMEA